MAFSLHDATVPSFLQTLGAVSSLIDKAEAFCLERNLPPDDVIQARLIADMHPFAYQVKSTVVHSVGALDGVRAGVFSPDTSVPPDSFAGLRARVTQAITTLAAISPDEVNRLEGGDMRFQAGEKHLDFTAENFLMSFSMPNFYFHATTAYDILRMQGVKIGKRDFSGRRRTKP